jgi:pyruvate kinase
VLALSPRRDVVRRCQLLWGVHPQLNEEPLATLELIDACARAAVEAGLVERGEKIGITAGLPAGRSGGTNLFKVHTVE